MVLLQIFLATQVALDLELADSEIATVIGSHFYVDDLIKGANMLAEAK